MSHSVTITRTTTTSANSSYIVLNTGYFKTVPGLLKLFQLILGIVCFGISAYYYDYYYGYNKIFYHKSELFFLLMTLTFLIGTFCILLSCFCSLSTGSIISKTLYEVVYHSIACILLLVAGIFLLVETADGKIDKKGSDRYNALMAASIIALVNAALYCVSTIYAHRSYRGI